MKVLSNSAVKPLIMDSVTTSLNTERQNETQLRAKKQNWHCDMAQEPHRHAHAHSARCSSSVYVWGGGGSEATDSKLRSFLYM